jgi:hypothetical protein
MFRKLPPVVEGNRVRPCLIESQHLHIDARADQARRL